MQLISGFGSSFWGTANSPQAREMEEGLIANEDRSHEVAVEPITARTEEPDTKAAKVKPDPVLLKLEIPCKGELEIAKYWVVEDDEDEVESTKKRAPLGAKQHAAVVAGVGASAILSGYLGSKSGGSVLGAGIAGAVTDLIKTYHAFTKDRAWIRNTDRAIALMGLGVSLYLRYGLSTEQQAQTLYRVLSALPWAFPGYGVLKAEMAEWDIPKQIVKISEQLKEKNYLSSKVSKNSATLISAALQIPPALALSILKIDQSLSAGAGILFKTNLRKFMNLVAEVAADSKNPLTRKIAGGSLACAATAATVAGYVGNCLHWFTNTLGTVASSLLLVGPSDAGVRTIKSTIRLHQDKAKERKEAQELQELDQELANLANDVEQNEERCLDKLVAKTKAAFEGALFSLPAIIMSLLVGQMNSDMNNLANAGLMAALLSDAVALSKLGTKEFSLNAVMATSGLAVTLGLVAFTINEYVQLFKWPMLSSTLALASIATSYMVYHTKRLTRPPKIKDLEKKAKLDDKKAQVDQLKKEKKAKKEKKEKKPSLEPASMAST